MDVTMVTEGTYPHGFGGVSVWCDQLVRGMSEVDFHVAAISATGTEELAWQLPRNVTTTNIPLWGRTSTGSPGRPHKQFEVLYRELVAKVIGDPDGPPETFTEILRAIFELSMTVEIEPSFRSEKAVGWLLDGWSAQRDRFAELGIKPSVHDALTSVDLLDHALRPLFVPVRPAQVTHAVTNGLAALVGLAAKWTDGTPFVLTEHGVYLRERYLGYRVSPYTWPVKAFMLGFLRQLCGAAYLAADLVTPGNRYNQRWETRFGAIPDRLRTVYNGVDPEHFPPAGAEPAVPTISWAGRIDPIKDLETLIRSFARMRDELPDLRLRMFGGVARGADDYLAGCKALITQLGLDGAAVFEGRVENIRDAYTAGHVVMLSSISEGFPYTLIEAMTSGRATVSTDVGGVTEAVGNTGLVVPPRDPEAMAKAALTLLGDDPLRHRLGAQARTRALEYFTVEQAVDTFRQIYADLSAGRSARGVDAVTELVPAPVLTEAAA